MEKQTLVFTNGNKYEVDSTSSITYMSLTVAQFSDVDAISNDFTEENMRSVTLNGTSYSEIIPLVLLATKEETGVRVVLQARVKTFEEKVSEVLNEHADALMELAGGME